MNLRVERWTLAVGQGLFHYEEVWLDSQPRPLTIVYDAGTIKEDSDTRSTPVKSVYFVRNRIRLNADGILDYLILSHFHQDHFNLMDRLIKKFRVRYFIAPLLTPKKNYFEIKVIESQWDETKKYKSYASPHTKFMNSVVEGLVEDGSEGFCKAIFRENQDQDRYHEDIYDKHTQFIFITDDEDKTADGQSNRDSIVHGFPENIKNEVDSQVLNHSNTINIKINSSPTPFWQLAFFYSKPTNSDSKMYEGARKKICEEFEKAHANQHGDSLDSGKQNSKGSEKGQQTGPIGRVLAKKDKNHPPIYIPIDPDTGKPATLKSIFGDSNLNMTSLVMYSGAATIPKIGIKRTLTTQYSSQKKYTPQTLTYFVPVKQKGRKSTRAKCSESSLCKKCRSCLLNCLYADKYVGVKHLSVRDCYWSWMGFGDLNFETNKTINQFIKHFQAHGNLLDYVGCCTAPHHGSNNGFKTSQIPELLSGAVCLISCDPCENYHHPHSEALTSMLKGGMIPVLVTDKKDSTFHEIILLR